MAQTRGIGFGQVRSFVHERFGDAGWERVLAALSPADRELVLGVAAVGWYDLGAYARLLRAADATLGQGDLALTREIGAYEAEHDVGTVLRLAMRTLLSPATFIEKFGSFWSRYHDSGGWTFRRQEGGIDGELRDFGVVDRALCTEMADYFVKIVTLGGYSSVVCSHPLCRATGDALCRFEVRWR